MIGKAIYRQALWVPALFLLMMAGGYLLQLAGLFSNCAGAIMPLVPEGLTGIFTSPFLHGDLDHLTSNAIPAAVLLFLLFQFYPTLARNVFFSGWFFTGLLVWLIPEVDLFDGAMRSSCIIGASGIIYMLAFFIFFSGVLRRDRKLLTVALLVALYYGSMIWGIFPEELFFKLNTPSRISWQSPLAGAAVGIILAFTYKGVGEKPKKFIWEFPNYYSEKDDLIWQQYQQQNPGTEEEYQEKMRPAEWEHLDALIKRERSKDNLENK